MSREAHPMRAAERRKIVAPGESPGFSVNETISTVGATDSCDSFAPTGLDSKRHLPTGLRPWLRSVAALRLNKDAAIAATSVTKLIATSSLTWTVLPLRGGESSLLHHLKHISIAPSFVPTLIVAALLIYFPHEKGSDLRILEVLDLSESP